MAPETWEDTTLGALCAAGGGEIQTGPFGSQLHARDYVRHGVPVVMPQDIVGGQIDTSAIAQVRERDAARLVKHRLRANDVVYSRRGDVRKCALVTSEQEGWLCGTGCLRVRVGDAAYGPFVGAYLTSQSAQDWVENNAVGLTMLNLNTGILSRVPIGLPALSQQQAIVEALGASRARLEAVGDLVERARVELAALEIDLCSRGPAKPLASIADITMGQSPPSSLVTGDHEAGTAFCQGSAEFTSLSPIPRNWFRGSGHKRAAPGAVLMSVRAPVGDANLADREFVIGRGLAAVLFRDVPPIVALASIREAGQRLRLKAQGSTFDAVDGRSVTQLLVRLPPPDELNAAAAVLNAAGARLGRLVEMQQTMRLLDAAIREDLLAGRVTA